MWTSGWTRSKQDPNMHTLIMSYQQLGRKRAKCRLMRKREGKEHLRQEVEREEEVEHNNGGEIKENHCVIPLSCTLPLLSKTSHAKLR